MKAFAASCVWSWRVLVLLLTTVGARAQGDAGTALRFDGKSTLVIAPPVTAIESGITVEAWFKPNTLPAYPAEQFIVRQGSGSDWASNDFALLIRGQMLVWTCRIRTDITHAPMEVGVLVDPAYLLDGKWHYIAGTYSANSGRAIYLDGVSREYIYSGGTYWPDVRADSYFSIGAAFDGADSTHHFAGEVDEVRISNYSISADAICWNMNRRLSAAQAGLVGYWRLDEGEGRETRDSSRTGLVGKLLDGPSWTVSGAMRGLPVVNTLSATLLTGSSASLTGSTSLCGMPASGWFDYGLTSEYGFSTQPIELRAVSATADFSQAIADLIPDTTYHFRAVAVNAGGRAVGPDRQFRTGGAPKVTTLWPVNATTSKATLRGNVDPDAFPTTAWFEWGLTESYGQATPTQVLDTSSAIALIAHEITNLAPGHVVHYRVVATNLAGINRGLDQIVTPAFSNTMWGGYIYEGSLDWRDYDGDGFSDLLVTGGDHTNVWSVIFKSTGESLTLVPRPEGGWYSQESAGLVAVALGGGQWGDFDNDGDLDVVLTGYAWESWQRVPISRLFYNVQGRFVAAPVKFAGLAQSCVASVDFDNDGWLDFAITGTTDYDYASPPTATNLLYRNLGDGTFQEIHWSVPGVIDGAMAWADYNNDGLMDLAIMGNSATGYVASIYRNENGVFRDSGMDLPRLARGTLIWGDYDNDGWPDLLLTGQTNQNAYAGLCRLYVNQAGNRFTPSAEFPGVYESAAAWGDFDGDGRLDVVLSGRDPTISGGDWRGSMTTRVFQNSKDGFHDIFAGLQGQALAAVAWADYDNDQALDLSVSGLNGLQLLKSFMPQYARIVAIQPPPDESMATHLTWQGCVLTWGCGMDSNTPAAGLTYNLRVGTSQGGSQILAADSDPVSGWRRVPRIGNAQHRQFTILTNLPIGHYHWSVQSVNHAFAGSAWSAEQAFTLTSGPPIAVTFPATNILCCSATFSGSFVPGSAPQTARFEYGTEGGGTNTTPTVLLQPGFSAVSITQQVSGLTPQSTYWYRAVVSYGDVAVAGTNLTLTTEYPAPIVETFGVTNVSYYYVTLLGRAPRDAPTADVRVEWGSTTNYGFSQSTAILDSALRFGPTNGLVEIPWGRFARVTNNFTVELWANPAAARVETGEFSIGFSGGADQKYAIFPEHGDFAYQDSRHVGMGLSVGTNGISIVEHTSGHIPTVLVYTGALSGWSHVAVVYSNRAPSLLLNGQLVRTGIPSSFVVHPSVGFGGTISWYHQYGPYVGGLDDVRIWDVPLSAQTIVEWKDLSPSTNHPAWEHLCSYWPMDEGVGKSTFDLSTNGLSGGLSEGVAWISGPHANATVYAARIGPLEPGTTYHFRVVASNSGGRVCGQDMTFTMPVPRVVEVRPISDTVTFLRFIGLPQVLHAVETSTNLTHWVRLARLKPSSTGEFDFTDTAARDVSARFYRLVVED
jgi:hypothetical protein